MARTMGWFLLACLAACGEHEARSASFPIPELVAVEAAEGVHIVGRIETSPGQVGVVTQVRVIDGGKALLGKIDVPPGAEPRSHGLHLLAPIGTKGVRFEMDVVEAPGQPPTVVSSGPLPDTSRQGELYSMDGQRLGNGPRLPDVAWYKDAAGVHIACALPCNEAEFTALSVQSGDGAVLGRSERGPRPMALYVLAPAALEVFEVAVERQVKLDDGQLSPLTVTTRHAIKP